MLRDRKFQKISLNFELDQVFQKISDENQESLYNRRKISLSIDKTSCERTLDRIKKDIDDSFKLKKKLDTIKISSDICKTDNFNKKNNNNNNNPDSASLLNSPDHNNNLKKPAKEKNEISIFTSMESKKTIKSRPWSKYGTMMLMGITKPCIYFLSYMKTIYRPMNMNTYNFSYRILVKGLKKLNGIIKYYFIIDLIRYLLLSLFVISMLNLIYIQIIVLELVCFVFISFMVIKKPFVNRLDMLLSLINETLINCSYISATILAYMDREANLDVGIRMNLGWVIVFSYVILMYSLIFNTFQRLFRLLYFFVGKFIVKIKKNI